MKQIANAPIYIGYKNIKAKIWIPPGIDESKFYPHSLDEKAKNVSKSLNIGIIGRAEPQKGTVFAIEAFKMIENTLAFECKLKVAFDNLPDLHQMHNVDIVVPKSDKDLGDFYRSLDVLVAPGIVQLGACHYPVIEAMACGIPVVTTGYLPATNRNAWIVPIKDALAIQNRIIEISSLDKNVVNQKVENALFDVKPFFWADVSNRFLAEFSREK
jgi:glycosyltransferase involved in cell wall biosynthesis